MDNFLIEIANSDHLQYAYELSMQYQISAQVRGTGIAQRRPEYIMKKINSGNAVIATIKNELAGFCYIETFKSPDYVSNSGLIVLPKFRGNSLASRIKEKIFEHARNKYPDARVIGITTSSKVMKINSDLGYRPVALPELTTDKEFLDACSSCSNYDILMRNQRKMCLCTGMMAPSQNSIADLQQTLKTQKQNP